MEIEGELKIPFKNILPQMDLEDNIREKCKDIIAYLTSEFYGLDIKMEKRAIKLALACEGFLYG